MTWLTSTMNHANGLLASILERPSDPETRADRTIDARGYVVMPAGVDVHCHIAGSKVNAARASRPSQHTDFRDR